MTDQAPNCPPPNKPEAVDANQETKVQVSNEANQYVAPIIESNYKQLNLQNPPQAVTITNEVFSSQHFILDGTVLVVPPDTKLLTEEEIKKSQKKEKENFPNKTDCCYDKIFLCLIGEVGVITCAILGIYISAYIHIVTGAFAIVYVVDFFVSATFKFFRNKKLAKDVLLNIEHLKQSFPRIIWNIQCYHFETHSYSNGDHTETRTERVDTHFAKHELKIKDAVDKTELTEIINHLKLLQMCRLYFGKEYSFDTPLSQSYYDSLKKYFITFNKRDTCFDFWEQYTIDGFEPRLVAHNGDKIGRVYSIPFYIFMTLFGLGWLLRLLFYKNTFCGEVKIKKVINLT
jgi:hypothetical protein